MNKGKINKLQPLANYTKFSNDLVRSKDLTLNEKGLLFFLLSHPEHWVINKQYLYNSLPDSRGTIDNSFKGLSEKGFIISTKIINEKGQFKGWNHEVHPHRLAILPKSVKPTVGISEMGESDNGKNPKSEKTSYSNIEDTKIDYSNKIIDNNKILTKASEIFSIENVRLLFANAGKPEQADTFFYHYESLNWMVAGTQIVKIEALVNKWISNNQNKPLQNGLNKPSASTNIEQYQRHFDDCIEYIKELGI
jgi:hypothetical protein